MCFFLQKKIEKKKLYVECHFHVFFCKKKHTTSSFPKTFQKPKMASLSNGPNAAKYATAAMQKAVETIVISVIQQLPDDSKADWITMVPAITALHFGRKPTAPRKSKKKSEAKSDEDEKEVGYASGSEVKVAKSVKKREEEASEDEAKPVKAKVVKKYEDSEDEAKPVKAKVVKKYEESESEDATKPVKNKRKDAESSDDETKPVVKDKRKKVEDEKKKSTYAGTDSD